MKNMLILTLLLVCSFGYADNITRIGNKTFVVRNPHSFCSYNNMLWFGAHNGNQGVHLFHTDGTPEGVKMNVASYPENLANMTVANGRLYFTTTGVLYYTQGFNAYPVYDFNSLGTPVTFSNFHEYNGRLLFIVKSSGGSDLYAMDLVQHGVVQVAAYTSNSFSDVSEYAIFNNKIYFPARYSSYGRELWVSDLSAINTQMVKDIYPGGDSNPSNLTVFGNRLYFSAENEPPAGGFPFQYKPWSTDGTAAGTQLVKNIYPPATYPIGFADLGSKLLFVVQGMLQDYTFYATDGSTTDSLKTLPYMNHSFVYKGHLYFGAGVMSGRALWRSDGTTAGTSEVVNSIHLTEPQCFAVYNDKLYLKGTAPGVNAFHLWSTDGSNSKQHVFPAIHNSPLHTTKELYEYNGGLYFSAMYDTSGYTLWKLDLFPTSIETTIEQSNCQLYPNPARDQVTLGMPEAFAAKNVRAEMRNLAGQRIATLYDGAYAPHLRLDLSAISAGVYFIEVFAGGQSISNQQFVVGQ